MRFLSRLSQVNWITGVILPATAVLMETCWAYPWLVLMGRWPIFVQQDHPPLRLVSVLLLLGGGFLITRFSIKKIWYLSRQRLAIVACGIAALLIVLRFEYPAGAGLFDIGWFAETARLLLRSFGRPEPVVIALFAGLYFWWRGIRWAQAALNFDTIYHSFLFGLFAEVILILSWGTDPGRNLLTNTGIYIAGFFFFGLSSIAIARLASIQRRGEKKTQSPLLNGRWLSIISATIAGIVLVGIGVASIFSVSFLSVFGQLFTLVSGVLFRIIEVIMTITGAVIGLMFFIFQTILNMLAGTPPSEVSGTANETPPQQLPQAVERSLSPEVLLVLKWVLFALLVGGALYLLAKAVMRYGITPREKDVEEIHESLWSRQGFLADLRLFLRGLLGGLKTRIGQAIPHPSLHLNRRQEHLGRLNIREIYRLLLEQAAKLGISRRQYETPYEYGHRLVRVIPQGHPSVEELTDIYVSIRYGSREAETGQVDSANSLWQTLRSLFEKPEERK